MKQYTQIRLRLGTAAWVPLGVCLVLLLLAGCSANARKKVLSVFFDGVTQTPPPPTQRQRRDLLREIEKLKQELAETKQALEKKEETAVSEEASAFDRKASPIEQAKTWKELKKLLPAADDGEPDWSEALADGLISPKPGIDPRAKDKTVFSLDMELNSSGDPNYKVLFRHEPHTAWLSCANCHPAIFEMGKSTTTMTMDAMFEGNSCGVCHGKVAFPLELCDRCHVNQEQGS